MLIGNQQVGGGTVAGSPEALQRHRRRLPDWLFTFLVQHELGDRSVLCEEMLVEVCPSAEDAVTWGRSLAWRGANTCLQEPPVPVP